MRPKQPKILTNTCNLEEYLNHNAEVKDMLEKLPAVKKYIHNILKSHRYFEPDFTLLFAKTGNIYTSIEYVKILIQHGTISASNISSLLHNHTTATVKILALLLPKLTDSRVKCLKKYGIPFSSIVSILRDELPSNLPNSLEKILDTLCILRPDGTYTISTQLTKILECCKCQFSSITVILRGMPHNTSDALEKLLKVLEGPRIQELTKLGIRFSNISSILNGAGAAGPQALEKLLKVLEGPRIQELTKLGIQFSNISSILAGAGAAGPQALEKLLKVLEGPRIQELTKLGIQFSNISSILARAGAAGSQALEKLLKVLEGPRIQELTKLGIQFSNISSILAGAGAAGSQALEKLLKVLEGPRIQELTKLGIQFSNISGILNGAGAAGPQALEKLLKVLESSRIQELTKLGIQFSNISGILNGAGAAGPQALEKLLKVLESSRIQELTKLGIQFSNISHILNGAGAAGPQALEKLLQILDKKALMLLQKYEIKFSNFCTILSSARAKITETVQEVLEILSDQQKNKIGKKQFFQNIAKFAKSGSKTQAIFKEFLSSLSYDDTTQQTEEDTDTTNQLEQQDDNIQELPSTSTKEYSTTNIEMMESAAISSSDSEEVLKLVTDVISQDCGSSSSTTADISPNIYMAEEEYINSIIPDFEQQSSNILSDPDDDYSRAYNEGMQFGLNHSYASIYASIVSKHMAHGITEYSAKIFAQSYIEGFSSSIENHQKGECHAHNYAEAYADCLSSGKKPEYARNYAELFADAIASGKDHDYARNYADANADFIFFEESEATQEHILEQMSANIDSLIPDFEQQNSNILFDHDDDYSRAYNESMKFGLNHSYASIYASIVVKHIAHGITEHSAKDFAQKYIEGFSLSIENHQKGECHAHNYAEAYADCLSSGKKPEYARYYAELFADAIASGQDLDYARNYAEANTDSMFFEQSEATPEQIFEQMSANVDNTGGSIFNNNVEQ
ncbi:hypothetical protein [Orientia tsutsugamushi]|uniref:HTH cro/C1-type domain-containing protein n=1 Tax=Orientia tsutsugamushi TaxID=784 RepID=A0A2U3RQQ5_ORITS|nr:hypothetical protein [Orientia tsutsugamushi]KJV55598.1 helix-turn-helix family protein [Orientia tsutsugamushi str. Karp]SPR15579.1 Uncharacterised protein [Orientia tsutsugamushi]